MATKPLLLWEGEWPFDSSLISSEGFKIEGVVTTKSHCVVRRANALEGYLRSAKSGDVSRDIMIIHVRDVQIFQKGTNTSVAKEEYDSALESFLGNARFQDEDPNSRATIDRSLVRPSHGVVLWCPQGVDGDLRSRHERTNGLVDGDRIRVLTKGLSCWFDSISSVEILEEAAVLPSHEALRRFDRTGVQVDGVGGFADRIFAQKEIIAQEEEKVDDDDWSD